MGRLFHNLSLGESKPEADVMGDQSRPNLLGNNDFIASTEHGAEADIK